MRSSSTLLVPVAVGLATLVVSSSEAIVLLASTTATTAMAAGLLGPAGMALAATTAVVGALAIGAVALAAKRRRGKRDTSYSHCLPLENVDVFFTLAANSDPLGCGFRLVCELEATTDDQLTSEEQLVLSLFGSGFQYAAFVGSRTANASDCASIFDRCPFDRKQIMDAFRSSNAVV
ncbi:uncharacterized protein LOC143041286 [Oratosquilla oratoria]|uniref:uncharacterized protein LOC143041286 n=1 Tax=Oratosquilla oratoria TaxID=337810 RepID=UPI003F77749B